MKSAPQRERTKWGLRLRLYPFIAFALLAVVLMRGTIEQAPGQVTGSSPGNVGANNVNTPTPAPVAAPSIAASPSAILWRFEEGPLIEFKMLLTAERR